VCLDTRVSGLGVIVQPTGRRSFYWFRKVHGRPTWKTIGDFPDLTIEQARARASQMNAEIADWKSRRYEGPSPFEQPEREPTLGEILEDYCVVRLSGHSKNPEGACARVRWSFKKYVEPWRNKRLSSVKRTHVYDLRDSIGKKHGHVTANRVVTMLRTLYNWAAKARGWKGDNPASRIEPFPEKSRERFIQPDEMVALLAAVRDEPNRDLRDFVVLALFTGARMSDVLSMRWPDVWYVNAEWIIPNPKAKKPYTVPLMEEAIEILRDRVGTSEWVFPSSGKTGHLVTVKRSWHELRKRIGLTDLRVHDLRRTMGSWQANEGISLPVIGATLGHRSHASTEVYARLLTDTVRDAMKRATQKMLAAKT